MLAVWSKKENLNKQIGSESRVREKEKRMVIEIGYFIKRMINHISSRE